MTHAAFVRLIFLKDVRALRLPLLLLLALLIITVYWAMRPNPVDVLTNASFWSLFLLAGACLLMIRVVQLDPAGREFRFLLTRPVPGSAVGLAKGLFLGLFVIVPYCVGVEVMVAGSRVAFTPLDHLLLLLETVVFTGALVAGLVMLSAFLRNDVMVILTAGALFIAGTLLSAWWQQRSYQPGIMPRWPDFELERLSRFRHWLAEALFLAVAGVAIALRYRTRDFRVPLAWAAGGILASLLVSFCFPWDLSRGLHDLSHDGAHLTPEELGRIHLVLVRQLPHNQAPYQMSGGSMNEVRFVTLNQEVRIDGVESPYFVQTLGYHAVITLRSGKTVTSDYAAFNSHGGVGGLNSKIRALVAGCTIWPNDQGDRQALDLLTFSTKSLPHEDLTGATVRGVITLDVRRAYVAAAMPLRNRAASAFHRRSFQIENADFSAKGVAATWDVLEVPLLLRGDLPGQGSTYRQWEVIYRPFNEALMERGSGASGGSGLVLRNDHQNGDFSTPPAGLASNWRPLPPDWSSGAEFDLIESESVGQVSFPYEIDNVDLNYRF